MRASGCERVQRRPRQDTERPALPWAGADAVVEGDGRRVPVEDRPFHAVAALSQGAAGEVGEDQAAETGAAVFRLHVHVLDVEAGQRREGAKAVEPEGETGRLAGRGLGDEGEGAGRGAEQSAAERLFRADG